MRETRSATAAQKLLAPIFFFLKKGYAMGRKRITFLLSFPHGMECVDPLGLG